MDKSQKPLTVVLLGAVVLLAALVRVSSLPHVRTPSGWRFADGDSYYHLHRIEETVRARGRVPMFDARLSYPDGQFVQWHAGYDLPMAALVAARCGGDPSRACLEETAAWSTPVLGVAATLIVYWLGLAMAGPRHALVAAFLFAVYPFAAGGALLGHVDHHVLEPVCVALWLVFLARGRAFTAGLIAGLSLAVFPTALFPVGTTLGALVIDRLWRLRRDAARDPTATRFAVAASLATLPVAWTGAFPLRIEPAATSLFHVAVLGGAALACIAAERVASRAVGFTALVRAIAVWLASALVLAVALREPLGRLALFSQVGGLWTGVVQQQPLARGVDANLVLVAIAFAAGAATFARGVRVHAPALRALALASVPLALAGFWQIRFLMAASPVIVLTLAVLLLDTNEQLLARVRSAPARVRWLGRLVPAALALLLLSPLREYLAPADPSQPRRLEDGMRLLERLGPQEHAGSRASVLTDWKWGHHVVYFTPLATVANPFILSGDDRANVEARTALLSETPNGLLSIMRTRKSKYLLVSGPFDAVGVARSIGRPPPRRPAAAALLAPRIEDWGELRLADAEGDARLYERVVGAQLVGHAPPDSKVTARVVLRPSHARAIERRFHATASDSGSYAIVVSEWTHPRARTVQSDPEYSIGECRALVTEHAVRTGARVVTACTPHAAHSRTTRAP